MAFLFDSVTLILALVLLIPFQIAALVGVLFGMHRAVEPLTIQDFDLDHITQPSLIKLVVKLMAGIAIPAMVFHILFYVLHHNFILHNSVFTPIILFVVEFGAFYVVCSMVLHLDPKKSTMVAAANAVVYLLFYAAFIGNAIA